MAGQQLSLWTRFYLKTLCEWHLATTFRGWNPPNGLWTRAAPTGYLFKMRIADGRRMPNVDGRCFINAYIFNANIM